jgi:hypothetical protein
LQSFSQNGIVRKLAGLANQHKKLVLLGQWGIAHVYGKTDADAVFGDALPSVKTILNVLK